MTDEILRVIRQSELFAGLDDSLLHRIVTAAERTRASAGEILFQQGDPADAVWGVLSGRVKETIRNEGGREMTVDVIEAGEVFGEVAVLDWGPRRVEATAAEDCSLFRIGRRRFLELLQTSPELCFRMFALLCSHLRGTTEALEQTALRKFPARLAKRLMIMAAGNGGEPGVPVEHAGTVVLSISQNELAGLTGVNREAVNRHLRAWEKEGWLTLGRRQIAIDDIKRLAALAAPAENGDGAAGKRRIFNGPKGLLTPPPVSSQAAPDTRPQRARDVRDVGLMAVVVSDYSRDMMADAAGTLKALRAGIRVIEKAVTGGGGTIVGQAGDSIIAEFPDALAGLRAARSIQTGTAPRKGTASAAKRPSGALFCIGVHAGEIIVDGDRYFGPAINAALHVAQYAGPGDLYLSGAVQELVKDDERIELSFLGNQRIRDIEQPVAVYSAQPTSRMAVISARLQSLVPRRHALPWAAAIGAVLLAAILLTGRQAAQWIQPGPEISPYSIVVMPFDVPGGDQTESVLAVGIANELRERFTFRTKLRVIGRASAEYAADGGLGMPEIRERLGVAYMLGGQINAPESGGAILTQLFDTVDGGLVWSKAYDRETSSLLVIAADITTEVAQELGVPVTGSAGSPAAHRQTRNAEAYDFYLRAQGLGRTHTVESLNRAVDNYIKAIELDPEFADAVANLYLLVFTTPAENKLPPDTPISSLLLAAAEIDPGSPRIQIALSLYYTMQEGNDRLALKHANQALAIAPNDPDILHHAAVLLAVSSRYGDGFALVERAYNLDPLSARANSDYAAGLISANDLAKGEIILGRLAAIAPESGRLYLIQRLIAYHEGRIADAFLMAEREVEPIAWGNRIVDYAKLGLELRDARTDSEARQKREIIAFEEMRMDDVTEEHRQRFERNGRWVSAASLAGALALAGRDRESLEVFDTARSLSESYDLYRFNTSGGAAIQVLNLNAVIIELLVYQRLGLEDKAAELERRIREYTTTGINQNYYVVRMNYLLAQALAIRGHDQEAVVALKLALRTGFFKTVYLRRSPAFENLHDQPEFWRIIADVEAELAEVRQQIKAGRSE